MAKKGKVTEITNDEEMTLEEAKEIVAQGPSNSKYNAAKERLENPHWWEIEEGPAQDIIDANEKKGVTSSDIAERGLTPEEQGVIAKGNQGDNAIENPYAQDTSEVTERHLQEKASVQTPENMEPATFTTDPQKFGAISESEKIEEMTTPQVNDTKDEKVAKNRYKQSTKSIWDAYRDGDIDKATAGYFTIDALAKLASNLGRGIGNVGAQFTGGTIDQGKDVSDWEKRRNELLEEEIGMETEDLGGKASRRRTSEILDNEIKTLSKNRYATVNDLMNSVKKKAEDPNLSETERQAYLTIAAAIAGANMSETTQLASLGTGFWQDLKDAFGGNKK